MRVVIETGWACEVSYPNGGAYWLRTANGTTNRRQIKLYSSVAKARAAANFYPLPAGTKVEVFPAEVSIEVPDGNPPF